jgi:hypothetical protein
MFLIAAMLKVAVPRLALDEHRAALACRRMLERLAYRGELGRSADEQRR